MKTENKSDTNLQKNFWDSLQTELLTSNQKLSEEEYKFFHERNFMFSLFFRNTSKLELIAFRETLGIQANGYLILIEFTQRNKPGSTKSEIDDMDLHRNLKTLLHKTCSAVGPYICNRISILVSYESLPSKNRFKEESIALCNKISDFLQAEYDTSVVIGIGNVYSMSSIYSSFIDALKCINHGSNHQLMHILNLDRGEFSQNFDYVDTEKHLLEAIRLRKTEAYDYFCLIIDAIRIYNDDVIRNKVLELLVLTTYSLRVDSQNETITFNYTDYAQEFMSLKGEKLIEFAYQRFITLTGYAKPQNSIDYSNRIVQATKEYLETHYAEDISLEDIAEQVNISPQYFSKLIKKTTGFNFTDWLSTLRVKKAKELLTNSNLTVKEVCFLVGYKDPNYFSRIFKKRIGMTPSEFIKHI